LVKFAYNNEEEALSYLKKQKDNSLNLIIFDPPYAKHWKRLYGDDFKVEKTYQDWIWCLKREMARVLKVGGKIFTCGYETNGIGSNKGFEKENLLIVAHGGLLRDTFAYSEIKIEDGLWNNTWEKMIEENREKKRLKKEMNESGN